MRLGTKGTVDDLAQRYMEVCAENERLRAANDVRDLYALEKAIDALERLHDGEYWSSEPHVGEPVRQCLCQEAAAWRGARKVTVAWRDALGLKVRLLDRA